MLEKDIANIIEKEIKEDVTKVFHEENLKIYKLRVSPRAESQRRYQRGGYGDKKNITMTSFKEKSNGHRLIFRNITKARGGQLGANLAPLIEGGYGHIPSRPSTSLTIKRLQTEKIVEKALDKGLRRLGWIK